MKQEKNDKEESLKKLIDILKIVELDFECLGCNKIKTGFLHDLTERLQKTILKKDTDESGFIKPGKIYFFFILH